jgi:hypothetical protein
MTRSKLAVAVVAGALACLGGFAIAQNAPDEPAPAPSTNTLTLDDQVEQEARNLTDEEKLERSQTRIEEMKEVLTQTNELLDKVRKEDPDILKINCINEKLAAIKGFLKVSEESYVNLRDATAGDDEEAAVHHYTLVTIAGQKVNDLGEEALTCVGDVQMFADETVVDRREDPGIADIDVITIDDDEFDDMFVTETLPELTPFQ